MADNDHYMFIVKTLQIFIQDFDDFLNTKAIVQTLNESWLPSRSFALQMQDRSRAMEKFWNNYNEFVAKNPKTFCTSECPAIKQMRNDYYRLHSQAAAYQAKTNAAISLNVI